MFGATFGGYNNTTHQRRAQLQRLFAVLVPSPSALRMSIAIDRIPVKQQWSCNEIRVDRAGGMAASQWERVL